jgi:hypothetical protein
LSETTVSFASPSASFFTLSQNGLSKSPAVIFPDFSLDE